MNINVKTKIRFNGQEYSSQDELPPEAQAACRKAFMNGSVSLNKCLDKIILNGQEIPRGREDGRRLYEDIMSLVENNGSVTLPISSEPWLSRRQVKLVLAVAAVAAAVAFAVVARTIS